MANGAKACFSSKAVIRYLSLKGKTGKEIQGEFAEVNGSSASSYALVKISIGEFKRGRTSLEYKVGSGRSLPTKKCIRKFGIWYALIGESRWKK